MANSDDRDTRNSAGQATVQAYPIVYLYYMKPATADHWHAHVYWFDREANTPLSQAEIVNIVDDIDHNNTQPLYGEIKHLPWIDASYAVFVARSAPRPWHVNFIYQGPGGGNHNFFDAGTITGAGNLSGMWFENRRLRKGGGPLGPKIEVFRVMFPGLNRGQNVAGNGFLRSLVSKIKKLVGLEPKSHNEQGSNIGP
jgi:hypothetical protein